MGLRRNVLVLAVATATGFAAAEAAAQSSPLSRGFGASALGGGAQVPSLWYYGPSYSLRYDQPPADAGQPYRPSLRDDPFYGPDYVDRFDRGQRFGPLPPWYKRLNGR